MVSTDREGWTDLSRKDVGGLLSGLLVIYVIFGWRQSGLIVYPVFVASGLLLLYDGFNRWQRTRLVQDTAPEPVRSVAVGQTEVRGAAEPVDAAVTSPFSDGDCVLAYWEVEEYDDDWETIASGVRSVPFVVDDGTGAIRVEPPADATTRISDRNSTEVTTGAFKFVGKGPEPEPVVEFIHSRADLELPDEGLIIRRQRRYTAAVVPAGEDVYVFGGAAVREDAAGSNPERLVLSGDDATGEFIISDLPPEEFVADDRSWALTELGLGLTVIGITIGLAAVEVPGP